MTFLIRYIAFDKWENVIEKKTIKCKNKSNEEIAIKGLKRYLYNKIPNLHTIRIRSCREEGSIDKNIIDSIFGKVSGLSDLFNLSRGI